MEASFHRSLAALRAARNPAAVAGSVVAVVLLGAWVAWGVSARVALYEPSAQCRVETHDAASALQPSIGGTVRASTLALGRAVRVGEVLAELDSDAIALELRSARTRVETLAPQRAAVAREVATLRRALEQDRELSLAASQEADARTREARALATFADETRARQARLRAASLNAESELRTAESEAEQRRWSALAAAHSTQRVGLEQRSRQTDRVARIDALLRVDTELAAAEATARDAIATHLHDIELRSVRSPVNGVLGDVSPLRPGSYVQAGERLATVVPAGPVRVVAEFEPLRALGRIRPGQAARLRLEAFPWTEYGTVSLRVRRVASETRNGTVRVELELYGAPSRSIPLQHGLPGRVEVEVERVSPLTLLLRAAGRGG